jgi:hydrogenase nickel incorporation protein HypA/HybF
VIEPVPVTVYCPACDETGELARAYEFRCPSCGAPTGDVRSGKELEVASIVLADPAGDHSAAGTGGAG